MENRCIIAFYNDSNIYTIPKLDTFHQNTTTYMNTLFLKRTERGAKP